MRTFRLAFPLEDELGSVAVLDLLEQDGKVHVGALLLRATPT